ncbi:hypothetical protein [Cognatilysobacter lacus]|uniref:DUF3040 domain-containing protein n=1 Tax=Cognatilysobacter lacus TaxID=1643323 RepID=A0A5D8Z3L9_9GAMM|nr:hypothetical protein [Lysobacter lacus]TZF88683.1 hypothetical protein FW784_09560 [Lysobacter lacus]
MTSPRDSVPPPPRRPDAADAEAEAERLMAAYRSQQGADCVHSRRAGSASRWLIIGGTALLGAVVGAIAGAAGGYVVAGAVLLGLVGGLLAIVQQRPR